jgi:phospholipase C
MPAIWDSLGKAGVSGRYYYSNLPFVALWGTRYLAISQTYEQFKSDAKRGALPAVSFVDPIYTVLDDGTGNDDHPHADIRRGDAFLADAFHAVASGPLWPSTVFIVNYDEWGGFFDHVPPPRAAAPSLIDPDLENGRALLGFRVPTVVASPFTAGDRDNPSVNGTVFDHTSILKLIEWRWNLPPLTARDASDDVGNLATALGFENPQLEVPDLLLPEAPPPQPCPPLAAARANDRSRRAVAWTSADWSGLARSGLLDGWPGLAR